LREPGVGDADRKGLEARLTETDARLSELEKQIAASDKAVADAAAVPGAVVEERPPEESGIPEEIVITGIVFTAILLMPLVIANARRIWRRSSVVAPTLPTEFWQRFTRLEESVDSVAVEVERIGEGQRFTNRLFAEKQVGGGALQPVESKAADPARARVRDER
jgi:hypothetical protein